MTLPPRALHLLGSAGEGGAESYFRDLVSALHEAGLPTDAAIRANAGRERALGEAGVALEVSPFGGPLDLVTRPRVARWARSRGVGALVAWMSRAARHAPRGPWARIGRLGGYYDLKNYRGFDLLVGNTADIRDWMVAQGWPAERARYIPNFAQARPGAALDRASLDTPADAPLLLGMGRLHEAKAHDVTLKALALIPDAWLWIAGAGPLEAELQGLARQLGVEGRVRFLGWRDDPEALYRAADLCLFPSRHEPLGNVVIQAWAHDLPVIAAASQGPAVLIRDGEDGRLIPIDDPAALAEAARPLLGDSGARLAMARAGRARVEAEFSKGAVVAQWRALLTEVGATRCAA
jgi:glycosyltransferase involved in cell wall biosynthesis